MDIKSIYDDNFLDEMNNNNFYANPKRTTVYLKMDTDYTKEDEVVIGNAIVMNIDVNNEKIPVYSYNSDLYAKYLNGKKVVTGMIALRKTTVDKILAILKDRVVTVSVEEELAIDERYNSIMTLYESGNLSDTQKKQYARFLNNYKQQKIDNLVKEKEAGINHRVDEFGISSDLLYYKDIDKNNNAEIRLVFEGSYVDSEQKITDILFVRKQTEISINRNDIVEVYQFIGNPKID